MKKFTLKISIPVLAINNEEKVDKREKKYVND
jgi:hypothetical protein